MSTNSTIQTPYGRGVVQGKFGEGEYLVRLPVNAETRPHLMDSNCLTPRAAQSGLWHFDKEQVR